MLIFCMVPAEKTVVKNTDTLLDSYLHGIANGDAASLEALYDIVKTPIYSFAFSILKNPHDAEDVLHDCLVKIWSSAEGYQSHGKPMAWILTVARNLCMMRFREDKNISDVPQEDWERYLTHNDGLSHEDVLVIKECLTELSEQERQIVVLHAISGFKHREIAGFMEMPLSTVLSKYNRAAKKLKRIL